MNTFRFLQPIVPPLFQKGIRAISDVLFKLHATDTIERRKERILTSTLFIVATVMVVIDIVWLISWSRGLSTQYADNGLLLIIFNAHVLFVLALFVAVRKGHYRQVSYIFVSLFFLCTVYGSLIWGVSVTVGLLSYSIIALLAWSIISRRFALYLTGFMISIIVVLGNRAAVLKTVPVWQQGILHTTDVAKDIIMLSLIMGLSWVSNRELTKSFARTRETENELKRERDNLERNIGERTRALMQIEHEHVAQLVHFAEFGKISAGLFHDLMNPLTAVSLAVGKLDTSAEQGALTAEAKAAVERAINATHKMEHFMATVRKNIKTKKFNESFSINTEINEVLEMIRFKAKRLDIACLFKPKQEVMFYGNCLKFSQIISNIVSNALDSYADSAIPKIKRVVRINLKERRGIIVLTIADHGSGVAEELRETVFIPFVTNKINGLGLGLSTTKDIIEHEFGGTISFVSEYGIGTTFTIHIPSHQHE